MKFKKGIAAIAMLTMATGAFNGAASAGRAHNPLKGKGEGLKLVANIPWDGGTDMEFRTINGRDYAFAGTEAPVSKGGGMHVIDVTSPEHPKQVAWLKCSLVQNDIQISYDNKTLIMAADSPGGQDSCLALGKLGFMTVDISNPKNPKPIGFAVIPRGSHNTTAMPNKPYVYNSDSDLTKLGEFQIWSIKDPAKPKLVNTIPVRDGLSPHDMSFNKDGTLMVSASINHMDIWDTKDPENPTLLYTGQCPGCSITHDAKFTPDGKHIIVGDEGGGGGTYPCPGGALYFYNVEGTADQPVPVLVGAYEPQEFAKTDNGPGGCTAHVFSISNDGTKVAISWYTAGTRYLDVSSMTGPSVGPNTATGVKELGWYEPVGGSTWSSKFFKGPYIYSDDEHRGFDVYRILGAGPNQ
ncbi:MAG: LVIVD repeat-containing protein [Actinomycetota bacterium]